MPAVLITFFAGLMAQPAIRQFLEELVIRLFAEIFHRRSMDPVFLAKSDAIFAQLSNAKTEQEQKDAHKALQDLMAS